MVDTNTLFLEASRRKLRFVSIRGELMTEQLWDLPLTSRSGFDLDTIARGVNAELRELSEGSFVTTTPSARQQVLEIALEVIKCIIATKQADQAKLVAAQERAQKRQRILAALDAKETAALEASTREDLLKELAAIDAE